MSRESDDKKREIFEIIIKLFDFSDRKITEENMHNNFFLPPYKLSASDLIYLLFFLEDYYNIKFLEHDIINNYFANIGSLVEAVEYVGGF